MWISDSMINFYRRGGREALIGELCEQGERQFCQLRIGDIMFRRSEER